MMKLGLYICKTDIDVEKINRSGVETSKMVISLFLVNNKDGKSRFFEETFY